MAGEPDPSAGPPGGPGIGGTGAGADEDAPRGVGAPRAPRAPDPGAPRDPDPSAGADEAGAPDPGAPRAPDAGAPRDPWRRVARRLAYENPWITLHHDDVIRPDGQPGIYGVVHMKNAAIGVVAIDDAERVLLVGQWRYTLGSYSWEIPEGGSPLGTSELESARRELAEETGYRAAAWRELIRFATSNSVTDEEGVLYVATGLQPGEAHPEGTEELAIRWVPLAEALAMIERGEITDAMSQIGLLRVALERASRT